LGDTKTPPGNGYTIKEISYHDLPEKGYLYEYAPKNTDGTPKPSSEDSTLSDENTLRDSGLIKVQFLPGAFDSLGTDESNELNESECYL
ncbi:248_t:CDS:2, partial [Acaulospora colombiana]